MGIFKKMMIKSKNPCFYSATISVIPAPATHAALPVGMRCCLRCTSLSGGLVRRSLCSDCRYSETVHLRVLLSQGCQSRAFGMGAGGSWVLWQTGRVGQSRVVGTSDYFRKSHKSEFLCEPPLFIFFCNCIYFA